MVYFVGAGSGAVDLITVRGERLLKAADVIIYAGSLVNAELLDMAKKGCRVYNSAYLNLDEVIDIMKEADSQGKLTVRLHTGDPCVYGAIREQMDRLDELGIVYEICPGVSSFCGAAAALKAEYTLPGVSQSVIITRMAGRTPVRDEESIRSLASHGATMVIFLSTGMLKKLSAELIEGGYAPDTPAAIVYKATWPEQKVLRCSVEQLYETARANNITKTALITVGNFLGDDYELSKLYDASFTTEFREGRGAKKQINIIAYNNNGAAVSERLRRGFEERDMDVKSYLYEKYQRDLHEPFGRVERIVEEAFAQRNPLIFVCAMGIAVRNISPFINSKLTDSPVLVIDDMGNFVIPVLAGHIGGANELSGICSKILSAANVITTSTDIHGKFAVDTFAKENNLIIDDFGTAKLVSAKIVDGERVDVYVEPNVDKKIVRDINKYEELNVHNDFILENITDFGIYIGYGAIKKENCSGRILKLTPHDLVVGIGCKRNTALEDIEKQTNFVLTQNKISREAICKICSVDLKKNEEGIIQYAHKLGVPYITFSVEELNGLGGDYSRSDFVREVTGVDCVCERSAVRGANRGELLVKKQCGGGVTTAIARLCGGGT